MTVIIGIDPHKSSHTAVAIGCDEQQLAEIKCEPPVSRQTDCWPGQSRLDHGHGPSSRRVAWAICCPSSSSGPVNRS